MTVGVPSIEQELRKLLVHVRESLWTENEFREFMTNVEDLLAKSQLVMNVTVSAGSKSVAEYGNLGEQQALFSCPVDVSPLQCTVHAAPMSGSGISVPEAEERWNEFQPNIQRILQEHWRPREPNSALRTGNDEHTDNKRRYRVAEAIRSDSPVAYILLDCDGFGAIKTKLGGERAGDEVIRNIACFLRNRLSDDLLVFHPHGDEFVIVAVNRKISLLSRKLADFQDAFAEHDFRPDDHTDSVHLTIKMAVSLSDDVKSTAEAEDILYALINRVLSKNSNDRKSVIDQRLELVQ